MSTPMTTQLVQKIAELAKLPLTEAAATHLASAFDETLETVEQMKAVDISGTEPTHQVTGLENVLREDVVDEDWMLSQTEALANAPLTHNGYFVVPRILDNDE